jgi:uncharacterized protein YjiS (DUF1127 family)
MKLLEQIALLVRQWKTYLRVRHELETYSERELIDMGMTCADISRIALEAASLVKADPKQTGAADRRPALLRQRYSPYL